jgi:hypothetical protein
MMAPPCVPAAAKPSSAGEGWKMLRMKINTNAIE